MCTRTQGECARPHARDAHPHARDVGSHARHADTCAKDAQRAVRRSHERRYGAEVRSMRSRASLRDGRSAKGRCKPAPLRSALLAPLRVHRRASAVPSSRGVGHRCEPIDTDPQAARPAFDHRCRSVCIGGESFRRLVGRGEVRPRRGRLQGDQHCAAVRGILSRLRLARRLARQPRSAGRNPAPALRRHR